METQVFRSSLIRVCNVFFPSATFRRIIVTCNQTVDFLTISVKIIVVLQSFEILRYIALLFCVHVPCQFAWQDNKLHANCASHLVRAAKTVHLCSLMIHVPNFHVCNLCEDERYRGRKLIRPIRPISIRSQPRATLYLRSHIYIYFSTETFNKRKRIRVFMETGRKTV